MVAALCRQLLIHFQRLPRSYDFYPEKKMDCGQGTWPYPKALYKNRIFDWSGQSRQFRYDHLLSINYPDDPAAPGKNRICDVHYDIPFSC